jgi:excinuclease ABC subunit B
MAEELAKYLLNLGVKTRYIHSDVDTLERVEIMEHLRKGVFDVLVGINLLREGLDLPEVSLVAILDADKEGFLRSERSLTQTAGRAARNLNGMVIMYADSVTRSMQQTIEATNYRREKQLKFNEENGIIPAAIIKPTREIIGYEFRSGKRPVEYRDNEYPDIAADPVVKYMSREGLEKAIEKNRRLMKAAAKEMDFIEAARIRDEMFALERLLNDKINSEHDK